jgi:hypothetical protein
MTTNYRLVPGNLYVSTSYPLADDNPEGEILCLLSITRLTAPLDHINEFAFLTPEGNVIHYRSYHTLSNPAVFALKALTVETPT